MFPMRYKRTKIDKTQIGEKQKKSLHPMYIEKGLSIQYQKAFYMSYFSPMKLAVSLHSLFRDTKNLK